MIFLVTVQLILWYFCLVVQVIRAFGVDTFVDGEMFTVLLRNERMGAIRTPQNVLL
jgi:hypothetical protein